MLSYVTLCLAYIKILPLKRLKVPTLLPTDVIFSTLWSSRSFLTSRLLRARGSNLRWTAYFYLSTFVCTCVCVATRPVCASTHLLGRAELTGPRSAWVSSRGKIEAARCGDSGPPRISLPWVCSRPKREPPSGVSSRWTPRLRWGEDTA